MPDHLHAGAADARDLVQFLQQLADDTQLWPDFLALCDCGGRLAGTPSEAAAQAWCVSRLQAISPALHVRREPTPYAGWTYNKAELTHLESGLRLAATPLLGTASTPEQGLTLEVVDLGRGTPDQFRAAGDSVKGKAVLVQHEYPFSTSTVHRRVKLAAAQAAGAAAFLVAQPESGVGPVSGSSGRAGGPGIPAMGISAEAAEQLRQTGARVHLVINGQDLPEALTDVLVLDMPGAGPDRVVLSAHIDGHPLAESAIDNGTGIAAVIALARSIAPYVATMRRGLTICIFSAEEWALHGSREWLARLPDAERERIVLNVNLDSLAGSPNLTALTSGFPALGAFAQDAASAGGTHVQVHLPLMSNSDHANFAAIGIPAMRIIAGFDEPDSALRLLLTPADTRDLVDEAVLRASTITAGAILWAALSATTETIKALGVRDHV